MSIDHEEQQQTGQNISNAVRVLLSTYENVNKFMSDLDAVAEEENYISITPRFLRWKSDVHSSGWLISSFIKLYQSISDEAANEEATLRKGPIFSVDINLEEESWAVPTITIAKYSFDEESLRTWGKPPAVTEHWGFYYPTRRKDLFRIENKSDVFVSTPLNERVKQDYWSLQQTVFKRIGLVQVDSREKIKVAVVQEFARL